MAFTKVGSAETQNLTIYGSDQPAGTLLPYVDWWYNGLGSTVGTQITPTSTTWQRAYTGCSNHPWGNMTGTTGWVNIFNNCSAIGPFPYYVDFRIRFTVPSDYASPAMAFNVNADNVGYITLNGTSITPAGGVVGGGATFSTADSGTVASAIKTGLNVIKVTLRDDGGWMGLNYRIDLQVDSSSSHESSTCGRRLHRFP